MLRSFQRRNCTSILSNKFSACQRSALTTLSFTGDATKKPDAKPLREDVKDLGKILGACIKLHDPEVFDNVEKLRQLGKKVRK